MQLDAALAPIFADNNVCLLDAYALQTTRVPARQVGSTSTWGSSTHLSAMTSRTLRLRLDGTTYAFEEARNVVRYLGPRTIDVVRYVPPRMISIRRITTHHAMTLLLIDDVLGKAIAVIGDALTWGLDGIDVQLVTDRNDEVARI